MYLDLGEKPTLEQRISYYKYCHYIYRGGELLPNETILRYLGFCAIFEHYFKTKLFERDWEIMLPELYQYKPKEDFYLLSGKKTRDNTMFWFPNNMSGICKRIEILNEILVTIGKK